MFSVRKVDREHFISGEGIVSAYIVIYPDCESIYCTKWYSTKSFEYLTHPFYITT